MKKITLLFAMLMASFSFSQVVISENFDSGTPAGWTDTYGNTGIAACDVQSERDNLYSFSATGNLTTPNQVGASNATDLTIVFDYKVVEYSGQTATPAGWGSAELQYSTDDGATWASVLTIDDANHVVSDACATMNVVIPAASLPAASDVKLQIVNTWVAGDYYFYVDNFVATQVVSSAPDCATNPISTPDVACGNFDSTISWDAVTGVLGYYLTVGTTSGGNDILDNQDVGSVTSYVLGSQDFNTTYYWTLVPFNAVGPAVGCTENSFTTFVTGCYCDSDTTSVDGSGISSLQVATTDFVSGGTLGYEDFTGAPVDLGQGILSNVSIVFATGYDYGVNIWIDFNDNLSFEAGELMFTGLTESDNPTTFDASFVMPGGATLGTHRMRIVSDDTVSDATDPCNSTSWHVTMDVDVNIITVACSPASATATLVADCDNSQFFVDVDVTVVGDATEISDGTTTWAITGTGVLQVGPFVDASTATLTVVHSDPSCNLALGSFSNTCPISGQICETAIDVAALPYTTSDDTANYFDDYENGDSSCDNYYMSGDDVVYSYTPAADIVVDILLSNLGSSWSGIHVLDGCPGTAPNCVAFEGNSNSNDRDLQDVALTGGTTYYIVISTWAAPQSTTYDLTITENTCAPATVTYTVVEDCAASGGFFIDVEVTDMGTATDLTITNDQDATSFSLTAIGTVQFGPYVNATDVIITVTDDNDTNCNQNSPATTQAVCPPVNDDVCNAIALVMGDTSASDAFTSLGATQQTGEVEGSCFNGGVDTSVWFTFVAPVGGLVTVSTDIAGGTFDDTEVAVYEAPTDCTDASTLGAQVGCDQDGGSDVNWNSIVTMTGLTEGNTYYVQVDRYGSSAGGTFGIALFDNTLMSTDDFESKALFNYYPNPVNNTLTLNAQKEITNVSVYNMLGQEVVRTAPNAVTNEVNMSNLQTGAYFVKVTIEGVTETVRIIKN